MEDKIIIQELIRGNVTVENNIEIALLKIRENIIRQIPMSITICKQKLTQ